VTRSQLVSGLLFIAVGVLLLAEQAGRADAWAIIIDWWPTLVITAGASQLITRPRNTVGGLLLILLGGALLARTLGAIATIGLVWPVLLIGLGLWLLAGRATTRRDHDGASPIELSAIVNDRRVTLPGGPFEGGSSSTVFGDLRLDLRAVTLDDAGATLQVTTIFGDVRLDVPEGWQVEVSGPELFGDVTLDRVSEPTADSPVLRLRVLTVFGDIAIRSRRGPPSPASARHQIQPSSQAR